jgi:hypothetical protein
MRNTLRAAGGIFCVGRVAAQVFVTEPTRSFAVGADIADLQIAPVSFAQTITDSKIASLTDVTVGLELVGRNTGGFAGEMFVSITQDLSATSVLLNQVGVTGSNPIGAAYNGWKVSFSDLGPGGDIHTEPGPSDYGNLVGTFQPDGRTNPTLVDRPAMLAVFAGRAGNGVWRLNVADLDLGGMMRLVGWSITLSGETAPPIAVPEVPSVVPIGLFCFLTVLLRNQGGSLRRPDPDSTRPR